MPWIGFSITLLVVYLVQTALAHVFPLPWFDAFLTLALVFGIIAPTHDARIAAWIVGLVQDLGSIDTLGIHAFCLGLAVFVLTLLRDLVNLRVWWVRAGATFLVGWAGQALYLLYLTVWIGHAPVSGGNIMLAAAATAAVAALLATAVTGLPWFARRQRRYLSAAAR